MADDRRPLQDGERRASHDGRIVHPALEKHQLDFGRLTRSDVVLAAAELHAQVITGDFVSQSGRGAAARRSDDDLGLIGSRLP